MAKPAIIRPMKLTEKQKKHLRREAHARKPIMAVGDHGLSKAFLEELDTTLEHHELLKIRVRAGDRDERDETIARIVEQTRAVLVSRVGNVAAIYRRRRKNPAIALP